MAKHKLTALAVKRAKRNIGDGDGLWLHVSETGRKSWRLRFMLRGRSHEMGLGSLDFVSLEEAREAATNARKLLKLHGTNPIQARRAQAQAQQRQDEHTFQTVAEAYITAHTPRWRSARRPIEWRNSLRDNVFSRLGRMSIAEIGTADVMAVLKPVSERLPQLAERLRGRIERVLDYGVAHGMRAPGDNPARLRGHIANLLPRPTVLQKHHAALDWREIGALMTELARMPGADARCLRFTILTATRSGESRGAEWSEIDLGSATWTIPAARTKTLREHRVPLSDAAFAILREQQGANETARRPSMLVFPGFRHNVPLADVTLAQVLRRLDKPVTVHGFRSTFRDWAGETTSFPREIAEQALGHSAGNAVETAYRRGDALQKRRLLMDAWGDFCSQPARDTSDATVVPIRSPQPA